MGDFSDALSALVGPGAHGLSVLKITRLKEVWAKEFHQWNHRLLADQQYVYIWAWWSHAHSYDASDT